MLPRANVPALMAGWCGRATATRPSRLILSTVGSTSRTWPPMASLTPGSQTSTSWPGTICGSAVSGTSASNSISLLRTSRNRGSPAALATSPRRGARDAKVPPRRAGYCAQAGSAIRDSPGRRRLQLGSRDFQIDLAPLRLRKHFFCFGHAQILLRGGGLRGGDLGLGLPSQELPRRGRAGGDQCLRAFQRVRRFAFVGLCLRDRRLHLRDRRLGYRNHRSVLRELSLEHSAVETGEHLALLDTIADVGENLDNA